MMKELQKANRIKYSDGAVSLFVVIFTALLFVTITVGFTVLMLSNQQQSTNNDLAQSALDSAQAGTEDAKRVLAQLADCQERGWVNSAHPDCQRINNAVFSSKCDTINKVYNTTDSHGDPERLVQVGEDDKELRQAYTCVKISPDTDSYIGKTKDEGEIRVIPLKSVAPFTHVRISWLMRDDMNLGAGEDVDLSVPKYNNTGVDENGIPESATTRLPTKDEWINGIDAADKADNKKRGAILRVQSIQYLPGNVDLTKIDNDERTAFLYPANAGIDNANDMSLALDMNLFDKHKSITPTDASSVPGMDSTYNKPQLTRCDATKTTYLCAITLTMPNHDPSAFSYMALSSLYRATSFKVELLDNAGNVVKFKNVQPEIDSTGRANDVFRRVVSRVESADANMAPYPRAALGTTGSLCKAYVITDDPDDFHDYAPMGRGCPDVAAISPNR